MVSVPEVVHEGCRILYRAVFVPSDVCWVHIKPFFISNEIAASSGGPDGTINTCSRNMSPYRYPILVIHFPCDPYDINTPTSQSHCYMYQRHLSALL